jgi:ABC-type branched-subunit amino acid transport system substrate-binding protein
MNYRLKLYVVALACGFSFAFALPAGDASAGVRAGQASGVLARPGPLTEQERRGKAIYMRGESLAGRGITALIGEVDVPAATLTCAGCHGLRGEGITEGGVTAGNLTWTHLLKPYGHTHESGRKHGPFDRFTFIRATLAGLDPAGNELVAAMPRYRMAPEDLADLVAYVQRMEADRDPGLTEAAIKVAAVLPSTGPLAEVGTAMRETLAAYFEDLNGRGGIFTRKIEFRAIEPGADAAATASAVRAVVREGQVFALVGGLSAGADAELAALAREEEMPFIGPSTLLPQTSHPPNRYVFYLLPGVAEQARALVNFAASLPELRGPEAKPPRVFVLHPEGELAAAAAAAVEEQAKLSGWATVSRKTYGAGGFDVPALQREGADAVFFFGSGAEQAAFIREAAALGWTPHLFLLGATAGGDLLSAVPPSFGRKLYMSFPTIPSDVTPMALREFRALAEKYKLAPRHTASRLSALGAARTFVEGLTRTGADLSRERLITALEGLYDYETGVTPRLIFGPNRRIGAAGAYVVTIDPETKSFAVVGGWVKVN